MVYLHIKSNNCEWSAFSMSHYILTEKGGAATMPRKMLARAKESQVPDFCSQYSHDKTNWSVELKNDGSCRSPVFTAFQSYFNIISGVGCKCYREKASTSLSVSDEKQLASLKMLVLCRHRCLHWNTDFLSREMDSLAALQLGWIFLPGPETEAYAVWSPLHYIVQ